MTVDQPATQQEEAICLAMITNWMPGRLNCPLPILRAKKSMAQMASGQVLHIEATDPGAVKDFETFVKQTGHELQESREENGTFHFLIQKTGEQERHHE